MQSHWIAVLARAGYSARGVVYCLLGGLTCLAAFQATGRPDTKGAVRTLLDQPFGYVLVGLLVVGLAGYVFWRIVQAAFDPDRHGFGPKGLCIRGALLVSAFSYGTLALYAASLLGALRSQGDGSGMGSEIIDRLNGFFSFQVVPVALAIIFAGMAVAHWWKAFAGTYARYFKADEATMSIIRSVSIVGLTARGVIFATLSWLLVLRFLNLHANGGGEEKPGLKEALAYMEQLPQGQWILAGIGLGLISFALYSLAEARWRRISAPDLLR